MDKISQVVAGLRSVRVIATAHHKNKFSNWAKAVQLSVLEFVGRWRISGNDEVQQRHLKFRSTLQHSLTGQDHEPIKCSAYLP